MTLLIFTQAVDADDPVLGFFHRWLEEFAARFEHIEVVCLKEGRHRLPKNVRVHSLGKEKGRSRIKYVFNVYRYIFSLKYDAVFVHMNEEYVLLGGPWWRLLGKRVALWRNFKNGSWMTPIACRLAQTVCYTSPESFTAQYKHAVKMPVGIDTRFFVPAPQAPAQDTVLFLGRLDAIKRPDVFIDALAQVQTPFKAAIYGSPSYPGDPYEAKIAARAAGVAGLTLHGAVTNDEAKSLYQQYATYVNLTPSGSFDKTILEAMACGSVVVCANQALRGVLPESLVVELTAAGAQKGIEASLALSPTERSQLSAAGREYVEREHSLALLAEKLADIFVPKRVALLINSLEIGGAERVFVRDANEFAERGYRVLFLTLYDRAAPLGGELDPRVKRQQIRARGPFDLAAHWRIARACRRFGARALISTLNDANLAARIATIMSGLQLRLLVREANDPRYKSLVHRLASLLLDSAATQIIAVSEQVRRGILAQAPWRARKVVVLHNAVAVPPRQPRELHQPPRILAVGSLTDQKDYPTLIGALKILAGKGAPFEARVVGGWDVAPLRALASSLGERVQFTGALGREQVAQEYARADVFVLSSRWEGCPNVVLEAMAHGLPVVATNVGGVPELVADNETGLLVPPQNPAALAAALGRVVGDSALWNTLGMHGYERARDLFSNERRFAQLETLIHS